MADLYVFFIRHNYLLLDCGGRSTWVSDGEIDKKKGLIVVLIKTSFWLWVHYKGAIGLMQVNFWKLRLL